MNTDRLNITNSTTNARGMTMVEVMVAAAVMGIVFIAFMGAFANVAKGIQFSKHKSLASNLAQERMQVLKQQSYHRILVTTATAYDTNYTPAIAYDNGYYPPETIVEGGVTFQRLTYVQMADEVGGVLVYYGSTPDTGMKAITVTLTWTLEGEKKLQVRSVMPNPNTVMANCIINGRVEINGTSTAIASATIVAAENVGWSAFTNGTGDYTMTLSPGNHTLVASADGFFTSFIVRAVNANQTISQDFDLVRMDSGTVTGSVWINDHLVISQVVGSTTSGGVDQEWVEIYNPTTWTWTATDVGIRFQRATSVDASPVGIAITYITTDIAPNQFYLFANTGTITAVGTTLNANAVWDMTPGTNDIAFAPRFTTVDPNIVTTYDDDNDWGAGSLQLYSVSTPTVVWDTLGWEGNGGGTAPPLAEGNPMDMNQGLDDQEQFYRYSSTSGFNPAHGPAYDTADNDRDVKVMNPVAWVFRSTASATVAPVAGTPAYGAIISCDDGLSSPATAYSSGNPPAAVFTLTRVATGTYNVYAASSAIYQTIGNVTMTNAATVLVPNGTTSPAWPASNMHATILSTVATVGFVSGRVTNTSGGAITAGPAIVVSAGGFSTDASLVTGNYFLSTDNGTYDVVANGNNGNSSYISQSVQAVSVSLGQVTSGIDFILSQGGKITGSITRDGVNAIPGIAVAAYDVNDQARANEITGTNGSFLMVNLATGAYSVEPVLDSGEVSSPLSVSTTVTAGSTVNVGTFTITRAFGYVSGTVTSGGSPIQTGVMIVVSTTTITNPPAISSSTLTGAAYYIGSSNESGLYTVEVRQSTNPTYNLAAYYVTMTGTTPVITTRTASGLSVTAGNTTTSNLTW